MRIDQKSYIEIWQSDNVFVFWFLTLYRNVRIAFN